jgi:hypothetical protein
MIVPSSISSSERSNSERAPRARWLASWLLAFAIVLLCIGSWEVFWRSHDFTPSVTDDAGLWALARDRADQLGEEAVVLVGSSRMQMDIQRDAFAHATGWSPAVQLAVVRGPSIPVLENLAGDPKFRGTVVCEVNPVLFFADTPQIDRMLDDHFRAFEAFSLGKQVEQRLSMMFQTNFVTRLPDLSLEPLKYAWQFGQLPLPGYNAFISRDRFRYGDYLKLPNLKRANRLNARLMANTTPNVLNPREVAARLGRVDRFVRQIQARNGEVIFVHLPSSLHVLEYQQRWWKRANTWDRLSAATDAPTLHYLDHPGLSELIPPDGDHLGRDAADLFSLRLGEVLVGAKLAPGPG